jgi:hypothetical protein
VQHETPMEVPPLHIIQAGTMLASILVFSDDEIASSSLQYITPEKCRYVQAYTVSNSTAFHLLLEASGISRTN